MAASMPFSAEATRRDCHKLAAGHPKRAWSCTNRRCGSERPWSATRASAEEGHL